MTKLNIFTIPNFISFLRLPLALCFLQGNVTVRLFALFAAMFSDGIDGFIARRFQCVSRFGTFFDPLMDKFFVGVVLTVFFSEGQLSPLQFLAMFSRDLSVMLFALYLFFAGDLKRYKVQSIWTGKAMTFGLFVVLIMSTMQVAVPFWVYQGFFVLGVCAFVELWVTRRALLEGV